MPVLLASALSSPSPSTSMGLYDCALLYAYFIFVRFPRDFLVYASYAKDAG